MIGTELNLKYINIELKIDFRVRFNFFQKGKPFCQLWNFLIG